jgi:hypothetical protein
MDVVGHAARNEAFAVAVTSDSREVRVKSRAEVAGEDGSAVFRRKDEVDDD